MRFFRYTAAMVLVSASLSPAQDALHWARWAPEDAYAVATWQGAKAAAPAFEKSDLGKLWAEPTVHEFVMKPIDSLKRSVLEEAKGKADRATPEEISAAIDLVRAAWDNPGMVCLFPVDQDPKSDWPYPDSGAIVWEIGEAGRQLIEKVEAMQRRFAAAQLLPSPWQVEIEGVEFEVAAGNKPPLYTGVDGNRLIVAMGRPAARKILRHLRKGGDGFTGTPAHARVAQENRGVSAAAYVNVRGSVFRERATQLIRKELSKNGIWRGSLPTYVPLLIAGALEFSVLYGNIGAAETACTVGFEGSELRTVWFAQSDPSFAWPPDFVSHQKIDPKFLRLVPGTALDVGVTTLDAMKAYRAALVTTEQLIAASVPSTQPAATSLPEADVPAVTQPEGEEIVDVGRGMDEKPAISQFLPASRPEDFATGWLTRLIDNYTVPRGLNIERDILSHIGRHVALYQDREFAGVSINLLVELTDQTAFEKQLSKWLSFLPKEVIFRPRAVGARKLYVLDISQTGHQLPAMVLSPCYAVGENCLLISSNMAAGTRWLRSLDSANALPFSKRDDVSRFLDQHQGDSITRMAFMDEAALLQPLYAQFAVFYPIITKTMAQDFDESRELASQPARKHSAYVPQEDFDIAASQPAIEFAPLPDFDTIAQHMRTTISYTQLVEGGRVYHGHSGAGAYGGSTTLVGVSALSPILLSSLARARELSKRVVCSSNLKHLSEALAEYANGHDEKYPTSLKELIDSGAITPEGLRCPSSEHPDRSYAYIPGQDSNGNQNNVVVYELDNHSGEGANVLFGDGRVEFVKPYHYVKQLVRETKERLHGAASQPE